MNRSHWWVLERHSSTSERREAQKVNFLHVRWCIRQFYDAICMCEYIIEKEGVVTLALEDTLEGVPGGTLALVGARNVDTRV